MTYSERRRNGLGQTVPVFAVEALGPFKDSSLTAYGIYVVGISVVFVGQCFKIKKVNKPS